MKTKWSTYLFLLSLLMMVSCGAEQFGTAPQSQSEQTDALEVYHQTTCAGSTLVKPPVDILYVVDNSSSTYWIPNLHSRIQSTISTLSSQFDYRVIVTPLLETSVGNSDYQVMSSTPIPGVPSNKVVSAASQFVFVKEPKAGEKEKGLGRTTSFIQNNLSLFRDNAHLMIVLISNGRDIEVQPGNASTFDLTLFNTRKNELNVIKTNKSLQQLRFISVTSNTSTGNSYCPVGTWDSTLTYANMSTEIRSADDHFDICSSSMTSIFTDINSTIQQIIVPHSYKYWPMTVADSAPLDTNPGKIKVFKSTPGTAPVELTSGWIYKANPNYPGQIETRVNKDTGAPIPGEPTSKKHLVQFNHGNYPTYPECIQIQSTSILEYFGFFVIPKVPVQESVVIKVRGMTLPASAYTYTGYSPNINIKVAHAGYPATPEVFKSGYVFKITDPTYYYKSGDSVEVYYIPASL